MFSVSRYPLAKARFFFLIGLFAISSLISSVASLSLCYASVPQRSAVVKSIRIIGLKHIPRSTFFSYLQIKNGDRFTSDKAKQAIKRLYTTQFFNDVKLHSQNGNLTIYVEERPIIADLHLSGVKVIDKKMLLASLKRIELAPGRFFSQSRLRQAEFDIKKIYFSKGFYGVKIDSIVSPKEGGRLSIFLEVKEGQLAKIRGISLIGNNSISTSTLLGEMRLSTPNWFSWYSKSHIYSEEKFSGDIEAIETYYRNRGFYNFRFEAHDATISPDGTRVYLTLDMKEGSIYRITDISLSGDLLGKSEELKKLITIKKGDLFSQEKLAESEKLIKEKFADYGYAFPLVEITFQENRAHQLLNVHFHIKKGTRLSVREINIAGNAITRDDVIRREMRQFESSWYDSRQLSISKDRLNRLGYFETVQITPVRVKDLEDQVDIDVRVAETKTGSGNLSFGYSSTDRFVASLAFSKDNIFGSGHNVSATVNNARASRTFEFSHYTPYFTIDNISKSTNLFYRTNQPLLYASNDGDYRVLSFGGDLQFGIPFSELDRIFLGVGYSRYIMNTSEKTPLLYNAYALETGGISNVVPLTVTWSRDTRDNAISPSAGYVSSMNFEYGVPLGAPYYKVDLRQKYYYSFGRGFTLAVNGVFGYGRAYRGKNYPIFKHYYAGGIGTVRGYGTHSLGPRDVSGNDSLGGSKLLLGNIELMLPLPGTGYDKSLRVFAFCDSGNVWGSHEKIRILSMRYAYGFGLSWISPIGPLSISYGLPLIKHHGDKYDRFQFNIGTSF